MGYEDLLKEAYEKVKPSEECGRFEILKVTGHHEGSKTVITNFSQVASCLRRTPEHIAKFLGKELASSTEISGDRLILSRKLASKDINERLERYVNRFVICPKCKKPDTELISEQWNDYVKCLACGERYEVQRI